MSSVTKEEIWAKLYGSRPMHSMIVNDRGPLPRPICARLTSAESATLREQGLKRCARCGEAKSLGAFGVDRERPDGKTIYCKVCCGIYQRAIHQRNPQKYLWTFARQRAKRKDVPFSIMPADIVIPERCPVCRIRLEDAIGKGRKQNASPSVDRLEPSAGYVPGNIAVICSRCNMVKGDATAAELARVAKWMQEAARPTFQTVV